MLLLFGFYVCASVLCFVMYALDKRAARAGRRRWSERSLLLVGLAGGWPGAMLAQGLVRHKRSKASFMGRFYVTVVLNLAALAALLYLVYT